MGLVDLPKLKKYRPHAIVLLATFAAIITPDPTFFTMLALGVPMYLLYELGVVLVTWTKRRPSERTRNDMHGSRWER
jgi:sec-independent protein translocase protein TatC